MNWAHVVPGMLHPSGTMQTAGASYNWMVQQLCLFEQEEARIRKGNVYELIDEQIRKSPVGSNKLLFLPLPDGRTFSPLERKCQRRFLSD